MKQELKKLSTVTIRFMLDCEIELYKYGNESKPNKIGRFKNNDIITTKLWHVDIYGSDNEYIYPIIDNLYASFPMYFVEILKIN